jgi:hypothetical protein
MRYVENRTRTQPQLAKLNAEQADELDIPSSDRMTHDERRQALELERSWSAGETDTSRMNLPQQWLVRRYGRNMQLLLTGGKLAVLLRASNKRVG